MALWYASIAYQFLFYRFSYLACSILSARLSLIILSFEVCFISIDYISQTKNQRNLLLGISTFRRLAFFDGGVSTVLLFDNDFDPLLAFLLKSRLYLLGWFDTSFTFSITLSTISTSSSMTSI